MHNSLLITALLGLLIGAFILARTVAARLGLRERRSKEDWSTIFFFLYTVAAAIFSWGNADLLPVFKILSSLGSFLALLATIPALNRLTEASGKRRGDRRDEVKWLAWLATTVIGVVGSTLLGLFYSTWVASHFLVPYSVLFYALTVFLVVAGFYGLVWALSKENGATLVFKSWIIPWAIMGLWGDFFFGALIPTNTWEWTLPALAGGLGLIAFAFGFQRYKGWLPLQH